MHVAPFCLKADVSPWLLPGTHLLLNRIYFVSKTSRLFLIMLVSAGSLQIGNQYIVDTSVYTRRLGRGIGQGRIQQTPPTLIPDREFRFQLQTFCQTISSEVICNLPGTL